MPHPPDRPLDGVVLRLSVPFGGALRIVAADIAASVVEYLKERAPDAAVVAAALDTVAARVAPASPDAEVTFDFREVNGELLIEAHCGTRSSKVRCPLPA
jgi:hypothetical protein